MHTQKHASTHTYTHTHTHTRAHTHTRTHVHKHTHTHTHTHTMHAQACGPTNESLNTRVRVLPLKGKTNCFTFQLNIKNNLWFNQSDEKFNDIHNYE